MPVVSTAPIIEVAPKPKANKPTGERVAAQALVTEAVRSALDQGQAVVLQCEKYKKKDGDKISTLIRRTKKAFEKLGVSDFYCRADHKKGVVKAYRLSDFTS